MKASTPELMKFKRLQRRLGISTAQLVGHLELMWIATAKNSPEGDIGRFSNEDIAIACHWEGDPDNFVDSLVECGWLDKDTKWRLLVHNWSEHAPSYIHGILKRHGKNFREPTKEVTKEAPKEPTKEAPIVSYSEDATSYSSLACSSLTNSNQENNTSAERGQAYDLNFEKFWSAFPKVRRTKKQEAYRKWKLALKRVDAETLTKRAGEYAKSPKGLSEFAVMPSVWLNSGMWEDDPASWGVSTSSRQQVATAETFAITGGDYDPNYNYG